MWSSPAGTLPEGQDISLCESQLQVLRRSRVPVNLEWKDHGIQTPRGTPPSVSQSSRTTDVCEFRHVPELLPVGQTAERKWRCNAASEGT